QERNVVMLEPSLAWAYPPVAGPGTRVAGAASAPFRSPWTDQVHQVLATGIVDTEWFSQQGASALYARGPGSPSYAKIDNRDFAEVRPGIYVMISR
ncbi:MAG: hypothetical protein AAB037_01100, partial [Chloroflexota bacterium]